MNNEEVKNYIINWNYKFPIDRWWRKKYNIAFNSSGHRESSFLDQLFEFEEDKLFRELSEKDEYIPGSGNWLKTVEPKTMDESIQQLRDEFKDLE